MAELLLIKDQYELAFHSLNRGLSAEEGGKKDEALMYYRKGHMHLTQGVEVPTAGPRHHGAVWDTARQLQQKMRDTLQTVNGHLSDLQSSQVTPVPQRSFLLKNLDPPKSSLNHLYPTVPTTNQNTTPTPKTPPPRPPSPAVLHTHTLPAAAPGTTAMANTGEQPPVYTLQPTAGHRSLSYSPAAGGGGLQTGAAAGRDGHELIFIPSGVQMFFVAPNGQVSSLSYPGFLRIITFENQKKDVTGGRPSAFLHVCDCLYPLTTDTPVLLANSGVYMFPDCMAKVPGSYVGIVLSSELPAADREMFKDILSQMAELRIQGPVGSDVINLSEKIPLGTAGGQTMLVGPTGEREKLLPGWSEKMAQGILSGATKVSHQLVRGAEATGRAIHRGASKIRDHITPEDTPSEVSPGVTRSLYVAKKATGGAVRVSQFLVNGVSSVAGHVAEKVAPHVKKHGAKLVPESLKSKDGQPSNVDGAKHVAASGVHGFSAIWTSMETGAKLIAKSVASETVMCVTYKYGNDAGAATDTALKSVINVGVTAHNIDNLGIKAILKTTGKQAAKAMVKSPNGKTAETQAKEAQKREHQPDNNMEFIEKGEEEKKKKL
ncbi:spartin a isoform X2 [Notolabrus celidotus]|nr:spartin a isoform X2 [Notolabrus celidotus]XP_034540350.1 spartin a isoform X2 [Notolabrus celidotus]